MEGYFFFDLGESAQVLSKEGKNVNFICWNRKELIHGSLMRKKRLGFMMTEPDVSTEIFKSHY